MADLTPLEQLGIELATDERMPEVRTACIRVADQLMARGAKAIGFVPSDPEVAVPPVIIQVGNALCDLTGATIAVVDANVRYPGLVDADGNPLLAGAAGRSGEIFATRWLAGSLALLTPAKVERAGEVVPSLARLLLEGAEMFAHILCDLTGFELIGEHASAAACMDAVVLVGRAHETNEDELVALAKLMPKDTFAGVLLVG